MIGIRDLGKLAVAYPEILLSLACFFIFFFFQSRKRRVRGLTNLPLLGMFPGLLLNIHRFYDWSIDFYDWNGCIWLFKGPWFTGMDILATADPANINHMFNSNFANYPKGDEYRQIFDFLGDGILTSDSDSWKSQRKAVHSLISEVKFRRHVVRMSAQKMEQGLLPILLCAAKHRTAVDLQDLFLRYMFDTTSSLVFGFDPGCLSMDLPSVPFVNCEDVLFSWYAMLETNLEDRQCWNYRRRFRFYFFLLFLCC